MKHAYRIFAWCFFFSSIIGLYGCEEDTRFTIEQNQQIIFHYSYENYAFGYQFYGWCIDKEGVVWELEEPIHWNDEIEDIINEEGTWFWYDPDSIETIYGLSIGDPMGKIRNAELEDKIETVGEIINDDYSEPLNQMADAGSVVYGFLSYEKDLDRYQRVVMEITGDWYATLQDESAEELLSWLREIQQDIGYPDFK
jgi:hypothetical protein